MKKKSLLVPLLIVGFLSVLPGIVQAKGAPDKGGKKVNDDRGHNKDAPFDTGIGILIAAGAAYGLKKAYDKREKDTLTR